MGKKYKPVGTVWRREPNNNPFGAIVAGIIIFIIVVAVLNGASG